MIKIRNRSALRSRKKSKRKKSEEVQEAARPNTYKS